MDMVPCKFKFVNQNNIMINPLMKEDLERAAEYPFENDQDEMP